MSENTIPQTGRQRENNEDAEQDKTPEGPLQTDHGTTTIEENVVAKIAGMAARQVPGVYDMGNAVRRAFSAVTDRIPTGQTNVTGGISVHPRRVQQHSREHHPADRGHHRPGGRRGQHRRHRRSPARGGDLHLRLSQPQVTYPTVWI